MARFRCLAALLLVVTMLSVSAEAQLSATFYAKSCPNLEKIVFEEMARLTKKKPQQPADMLRLHFHDCFVRGCDASVLIDGRGTEQKAPENFRLEGTNYPVNEIKQALEKSCPNTVSCADVLAYAARAGVVMRGGPSWNVKGGRRDGRISKAAEASANLPGADFTVQELIDNFKRQGLTKEEMVLLSGAHTLGDAGCVHIDSRIHTRRDPILPADYYKELRDACPKPGQPLRKVKLDRQTPMKFDTKYYENLKVRKGLLTSDQGLYEDQKTKQLVLDNTNQNTFYKGFAAAMLKMSEIGVLTGNQGEIRKICFQINK